MDTLQPATIAIITVLSIFFVLFLCRVLELLCKSTIDFHEPNETDIL